MKPERNPKRHPKWNPKGALKEPTWRLEILKRNPDKKPWNETLAKA